MRKFLQLPLWVFWNLVYLFRNRWKREEFFEFSRRLDRCAWPWRKFKPSVYHCQHGKEWHVWFDNEVAITEKRLLEVEVHVGQKTGNIVGLDIWDETLNIGRKP